MRDYGRVYFRFWTQGTGKQLRGDPEAQVVATYLMTCAHSNMIGLYRLELGLVALETGLTREAVVRCMGRLEQIGFALYDDGAEIVYMPHGAKYQLGRLLSDKDRNVDGVENLLDEFAGHPFYDLFVEAYKGPYRLKRHPIKAQRWGNCRPSKGPSDVQEPPSGLGNDPSKGLARGIPQPSPAQPSNSPAQQKGRASAPAAAAAGSDPAETAIREALAHPSFSDLSDIDAVIADRLAHFRTVEMNAGCRLEWFIAAIGDAASDCAGTGMTPAAKVSTLRRYTANPRPPRKADAGPPESGQRELTGEEKRQARIRAAQQPEASAR